MSSKLRVGAGWGGVKKIYKTSEKIKDRAQWEIQRKLQLSDAVKKLENQMDPRFKVLLKDKNKLTQRDIKAMENWTVTVARYDRVDPHAVWNEWLRKNTEMHEIVKRALEEARRAAGAATAAAAEAAADAERLGVGTLDQCKETLARFKEENARLVERLARLAGAAVEGGARKRSRKNRRRRSKRTRRH